MKVTDCKGRDWNIKLNFKTLCAIEDETDWKVLETPLNAPVSLREWGKVFGVILEDQIKEKGIELEDFAEGLLGDQFSKFTEAVMLELAVFFKAPRPDVAAVLEEGMKVYQKVLTKQEEAVRLGCESVCLELLEQLESNLGTLRSGK